MGKRRMLKKIGSRIFKKRGADGKNGATDQEVLNGAEEYKVSEEIEKEFEEIRENRIHLMGTDFERAFAFIEKYPDHPLTLELIAEMNQTNSYSLKGLSYKSAVNILEKMPDHFGARSIIDGMYKIKSEYIKSLLSNVLIFILEVAPDHPAAETIAKAIVGKNFTNAYNFISHHPNHPQTRYMITAMFEKDPNIAVLLLKEQMDHPEIETIISGLTSIDVKSIQELTPSATIFIMEMVPDHIYTEDLIRHLVIENHLKALKFAKDNPDYVHLDMLKEVIFRKEPRLKEKIWS